MKVNLFIVTITPFIDRVLKSELCLLVRRRGPLSFEDRMIRRSIFPGECFPTMDFVIHMPTRLEVSGQSYIAYLMTTVRHNLGKKASAMVTRAIKNGQSKEFLNEVSYGFREIFCGIFVDRNILDVIATPVPYGTVDVLHMEDILEQEKRDSSSGKLSSISDLNFKRSSKGKNRAQAKKSLESTGLEVEHLHGQELEMARKILDHFQAEENARVAAWSKRHPEVVYAEKTPSIG